MKLYNSLTRKKEVFQPRPKERVNIFVCGPTVYDYSHLGHARTYTFYDSLVKFLRQKLNWNIFYLQNITDIDDKIIEKAKRENKNWSDISREFEEAYFSDMKKLRVTSVDLYARASEHIDEIVSQVKRLLEKKNAYKIEGDGYYFDISTLSDYGKLSGRSVEKAEDSVSRIDESVNKKNKGDFTLWKFSKKDEPGWETELGFGRPGWHIEDTAIAEKYIGLVYQVHGGGIELKFPHHEAEIAQMESLSGIKPAVKIWIHAGLLNIDGEKMSKSKNNLVKIKDSIDKEGIRVLKMFLSSSHYRSPLDYSDKNITQARSRIEKIDNFQRRLKKVEEEATEFPLDEFIEDFWNNLKDDFNTPKAFSCLFGLITEVNKSLDNHTLSKVDAQRLLDFLNQIDSIFNILSKEDDVPEEIVKIAQERERARKKGDFSKSDNLRQKIKEEGYSVEDTEKGPRIYKS